VPEPVPFDALLRHLALGLAVDTTIISISRNATAREIIESNASETANSPPSPWIAVYAPLVTGNKDASAAVTAIPACAELQELPVPYLSPPEPVLVPRVLLALTAHRFEAREYWLRSKPPTNTV
jgi:hypothetical protein